MARPCRGGGRGRGGRLPRDLERDHRRPDDDGAAERGLRAVVHPGKRRRRPGLRSADPLPRPRGVDGPRQPHGPRRGPAGHGRLRVPRPDRPDRAPAELPRDATRPVVAAGFYLVRAALMNMSAPIADSFLMGIVPPEQRGLASAVNSIIWRLPNSITTVFGGLLMQAGNYDLPIFLATAFYAAFVSGFYAVFRNVKPTT